MNFRDCRADVNFKESFPQSVLSPPPIIKQYKFARILEDAKESDVYLSLPLNRNTLIPLLLCRDYIKTHNWKIIILQGGKVMNSRKVFGTVICAILVLAISSAITLGRDDPAAYRLITGDAEESPPTDSGMPMDQSQGIDCCNPGCCNLGCNNTGCGQRCYCPRWTASADFIILDRIGSVDQTLIEEVAARHVCGPRHPNCSTPMIFVKASTAGRD